MSLKLDLEIQETHIELFKKAVRNLLSKTFVIAQKEKALFNFIKNPSNQTNLNNFFNMIGCSLLVDEKLGVAMLQPIERDDDSEQFVTQKFSKCQSGILIVLAKMYLEQFEQGKETVSIKFGDLVDQLRVYKIEGPTNERKWIWNALEKFRKLSLIGFYIGKDCEKMSEDMDIIIYDSIRMMLCSTGNYEVFQANVREYGYVFESDKETDPEIGPDENEEMTSDEEAEEL